ncbi:MAG: PAS domain S-box protein [Promethearchaeota archaeon]|nr:MAG: PAS domain S-box protein [Candidatus Lokiarchaeota archaeon]
MDLKDKLNGGEEYSDLKEFIKKYQLILENINDFVALTNDRFEFEYINDQVTSKLMGYTSEDLIGKSALEFVHPKDLNDAKTELKKQYKIGEGEGLIRFRHKKGHWEWLEIRAKKFKDANNNPKVLFISRIVTDRIEYQRKLELITENANDLITMFDENLRCLYLNEKAHKKILGYKKEDLIGKRMWELIHPDDLENMKKEFDGNWKTGRNRVDVRFRKKDGSYIWLDVVSVECKTEENQHLGVSISRDISKQKEFEELIKKENKELKKLTKMSENLINRVSHELRTPMSCIHGSIELMDEFLKNKLDENEMEIISIIKRNSTRLKRLINNILHVSKIGTSKFGLKKEKILFGTMMNNCIAELKYLIEKKKLVIEKDIKKDLQVFVDQLRIEEVIMNLLSNAIKNTPEKGTITLSLQKENDYAKFAVKDTGIGISKEQMTQLFHKFGKIERNYYNEDINTKGSGLGLFISKEIIEKHQGAIWAESEGKNKGSTFYFTIPLSLN